MADTLSCQWETLHSQQLRSIKKSIDSDHGIYRDRRAFITLISGAAAAWPLAARAQASVRFHDRTGSVAGCVGSRDPRP